MLKRFFLAATLLGDAVPCLAHPPADSPPWNEWESWKPVAFFNEPPNDGGGRPSGLGILFYGLVQKVGSAVTLETLEVYAHADKQFGADQINKHYLLDCDTLQYRGTDTQLFRPKGILPPSLIRYFDNPAPSAGSPLRRAFEFACGIDSQVPVAIKDPYHWAKAQLLKHREMVPTTKP